MLTGQPVWPGKSDVDQLYLIQKSLGPILPRHRKVFYNNQFFQDIRLPSTNQTDPLDKRFSQFDKHAIHFMKNCLQMNPESRCTAEEALNYNYFKSYVITRPISPTPINVAEQPSNPNPQHNSYPGDQNYMNSIDRSNINTQPNSNNTMNNNNNTPNSHNTSINPASHTNSTHKLSIPNNRNSNNLSRLSNNSILTTKEHQMREKHNQSRNNHSRNSNYNFAYGHKKISKPKPKPSRQPSSEQLHFNKAHLGHNYGQYWGGFGFKF